MVDHTINADFQVTGDQVADRQLSENSLIVAQRDAQEQAQIAMDRYRRKLEERAIPAMAQAIADTCHGEEHVLEALKIFNALQAMQKVYEDLNREALEDAQAAANQHFQQQNSGTPSEPEAAPAAPTNAPSLEPAPSAAETNPFQVSPPPVEPAAPTPIPASPPPPVPVAPPVADEPNPFQVSVPTEPSPVPMPEAPQIPSTTDGNPPPALMDMPAPDTVLPSSGPVAPSSAPTPDQSGPVQVQPPAPSSE